MRVVVADDEFIIREDLKEILQEFNYEIAGEASTVRETVEAVNRTRPDVLLLDIKLSDGNGLDAVRYFSCKPVIVVITAYADKRFVQRARNAGASAYLVKPFRKEDVYVAVEMALGSNERLKEAEDRLRKRKVIERAKGIIMEMMSITEREAYRYLQKISMDSGKAMDEISMELIRRYG